MKRISKQVMAGNVKIGGGAPVTVQSMLNVPSTDIEGSVRQAARFSALPSPIWMPCG